MKKAFWIYSFVTLVLGPGFAFAMADGVYHIQGRNSLHGTYSGQAWVHGSQVQRLIEWDTEIYQGKKLQSIWTGNADTQQLHFSLRLSNLLTSFNGYTPSPQDLQTPLALSLPATDGPISFLAGEEGSYSEQWQRTGDAPSTPLWTDLRTKIDGTGQESGLLVRLAEWAGIQKVISWYRSQPQAQAYAHRPEFQSARQYFIEDHTDADFYAAHPDTLRITNKTLNPLALAEAMMRRNAYGSSLGQKADFLTAQTAGQNLNTAGLLEVSVLNDLQQKVGRSPEYDSGLWTSMFGWAELMRYQSTGDAQALAHFRQILNGILTLVEITGNPQQFARTLAISPASENLGAGWVQGQGAYATLKWRQGGNNDMLKGIFMTLILAHQVVGPQETALRSRIQNVTKALLNLSAVRSSGFDSGMAHGLVALWWQDGLELSVFNRSMVNGVTQLGDKTQVGVGIYAGAIADWSGIQLSMVSNLCQILAGRELEKIFKSAANNSIEAYNLTQVRSSAESRLWQMQKIYAKAHRDFLTVMTYAFSPQAHADSSFQGEAREALWTLREMPAPRSFGNASIDLSKNPDWSLSAWPTVPWKGLKTLRELKPNLQFSDFAEGAYGYPLFEADAWTSTYLWKDSPFSITYSSNAQTQVFSSDYLLVYWAARTSGLIGSKD